MREIHSQLILKIMNDANPREYIAEIIEIQ